MRGGRYPRVHVTNRRCIIVTAGFGQLPPSGDRVNHIVSGCGVPHLGASDRSDSDNSNAGLVRKVMWFRYRKWKHAIAPLLLAFAYYGLQNAAEGSVVWYAGLVAAWAVGVAYVIEEIVWRVRGEGRPCATCGYRIHMKTFGVHNTCPHCGAQL